MTPPFTVIVKTFMRPMCCLKVVRSWKSNYPDCKVIVVDDGPPNIRPRLDGLTGVQHITTNFDIGLSAGRNIGVAESKTELVFICDDDNVCRADSDIAGAAAQMVKYDIDIAGVGAYFFEVDADSGTLNVCGCPLPEGIVFCGLVLNHFLAKRDAIPAWDESIKIAFEHPDFFLDCRQRGVRVAATPLVGYAKTRVAAAAERTRRYEKFRRGRRELYGQVFYKKRGLHYGRWRHVCNDTNGDAFLEKIKRMGLRPKNCLLPPASTQRTPDD